VQCEVQQLYKDGQKLRRPTDPVPGDLRLEPWGNGARGNFPKMRVLLIKDQYKLALPSMIDAVVMKITAQGLVVRGTEIVALYPHSKSKVNYHPQVWWCRLI